MEKILTALVVVIMLVGTAMTLDIKTSNFTFFGTDNNKDLEITDSSFWLDLNLDLTGNNITNVDKINGKSLDSLGSGDGYIGKSQTHTSGGNLDMNGSKIQNVGTIRTVKTSEELEMWGGATPEQSGDYTFGPYSPTMGKSHYIEKIQFSGYHPHRNAYIRDSDTGNRLAGPFHCDNWGADEGEKGDSCEFKLEYPLEINSTTNWEVYIQDFSDGSNRRYSTIVYGYEATSDMYPNRHGIIRGNMQNVAGNALDTIETYTVPSDKKLKITGIGFSSEHTYSFMEVVDESENTIIPRHTLGSHEWGNNIVHFGRSKTVSPGTKLRLRVYNADSSHKYIDATMMGYLKD